MQCTSALMYTKEHDLADFLIDTNHYSIDK